MISHRIYISYFKVWTKENMQIASYQSEWGNILVTVYSLFSAFSLLLVFLFDFLTTGYLILGLKVLPLSLPLPLFDVLGRKGVGSKVKKNA